MKDAFIYTKRYVLPYTLLVIFHCFSGVLLYGQAHDNRDSVEVTAGDKVKIYRFVLDMGIMPAAWRLVDRAVSEAEDWGADYIIFRLNTFGGRVDMADSISRRLLKTRPVTVVFIDDNAASAGALIAISCDSIYMSPSATIGAATVVNQEGSQLPDKYQSYMRATMRAAAEATGRDPLIAEAMVDDRIAIPGIIDSGYTLTFTTAEALQHGYCQGKATSIPQIINDYLHIEQYEVKSYEVSTIDKIINFLLHPIVSSLLMLVILGGLWFELQTPGVGFPLIAALIAAILYFAPHYLEGLAEHWEILLFLAGIGLLAIELFVTPGFGVAGITGIVLIVAGLTLTLIGNVRFNFDFTSGSEVARALLQVAIVLTGGVVLLLFFGKDLFSSKVFGRAVLSTTQESSRGYTIKDEVQKKMIGKQGTAVTDLHPTGKVEIEGEWYDAVAEGNYIDKGDKIIVTGHALSELRVDRLAVKDEKEHS